MINDQEQRSTDIRTFRFGSGQVLPLTRRIIQQIPYLDGLVSFVQHSSTAFDADGHLKLDPNIDFNHFCVIVDALPFYSLSQALIRLPKHDDSGAILVLMDYLGLFSAPYPTLDEIDSTFLFTLNNQRTGKSNNDNPVKVDVVQEMAAHFVFVLVKGDCDQAGNQVIAQIRWCAMFIIQADRLFHPILRRLVQIATGQYLHSGSPSLSQTSYPVPSRRRASDNKQMLCDITEEAKAFHKLESFIFRQSMFVPRFKSSYVDVDDFRALFGHRTLHSWDRHDLFGSFIDSLSNEIFQPLQTKISARYSNHIYNLSFTIPQSDTDEWRLMYEEQIKTHILSEIFEDPLVQVRIHREVSERIPAHIRDMDKQYRSKLQSMRERQRYLEVAEVGSHWLSAYIRILRDMELNRCQDNIKRYEETLQELHHIDQRTQTICRSVLRELYQLGMNQIYETIFVQGMIPQLKEKEKGDQKQRKKSKRCRLLNLKMIDKAQKQHHHIQKLPPRYLLMKHRYRY